MHSGMPMTEACILAGIWPSFRRRLSLDSVAGQPSGDHASQQLSLGGAYLGFVLQGGLAYPSDPQAFTNKTHLGLALAGLAALVVYFLTPLPAADAPRD